MVGFSKPLQLESAHPTFGSHNPERQVFRFRLLPFRSPLLRESRLISFPRGNEMFQFPPFASFSLWIQERIPRVCLGGFPHSEISGSKVICTSPKLIAACRVLHRRQMPRHPPCALVYFQYHLRSSGSCLPAPTPGADFSGSAVSSLKMLVSHKEYGRLVKSSPARGRGILLIKREREEGRNRGPFSGIRLRSRDTRCRPCGRDGSVWMSTPKNAS